MNKFTATNALVHSVSGVIEIPSKSGGNPFQKRELVINESTEKNGRQFANFICIDFVGDGMTLLNGVRAGMRVNVDGVLNGREYNGKYYTTVRGLTVIIPQQMQPTQPPFPQQSPFPQQGGYQNPVNPNQPAYQQGYPQGNPFGQPLGDLPF